MAYTGYTGSFEIRDPIHGFIRLDDWERDIVNHPVFQRLRRIKQLAWTDMVYPGATHTRFEHSLGVMHVATRMFKRVITSSRNLDILKSELNYTDDGLKRELVKIRLAGLLHDVGHSPFSHSAESLMPENKKTGGRYTHEDYSAALVEFLMKDVIDNGQIKLNNGFTAKDIADFIQGEPSVGQGLVWRELLSSQLDADRADYLLRDAYHIGVAYGRYDLNRLLVTLTLALDPEAGSPRLAIEKGGEHAAEGLILARYMMFTQVYFQHTRRAFDHHIEGAIRAILEENQADLDLEEKGCFPPPTSQKNLEAYLNWSDWRVLGLLADGGGGEHGEILRGRKHDRCVWETPEVPKTSDLDRLKVILDSLEGVSSFVDEAEKSWYKLKKQEILIENGSKSKPLSEISSVVRGLDTVKQHRIYVPFEAKEQAKAIMEGG